MTTAVTFEDVVSAWNDRLSCEMTTQPARGAGGWRIGGSIFTVANKR
jgi:hypothetical protein